MRKGLLSILSYISGMRKTNKQTNNPPPHTHKFKFQNSRGRPERCNFSKKGEKHPAFRRQHEVQGDGTNREE